MKIGCVVVNLKFRDGKIEVERNVAIQTRAVNMRGIGVVDFGNEKMNASFETVPIDGLKLSLSGNIASSIGFIGNLGEPEIRLRSEAVAEKLATATGLGLAIGALTGGVGLLVGAGVGLVSSDFIGNWAADPEPCKTALTIGAPKSIRGDPSFLNKSVFELTEDFMNN